MLSRIVRTLLRKLRHSSATQSRISHPHLVAKSATIRSSVFQGPITIGERSKVAQSLIRAFDNGKVTIGSNTTLAGPAVNLYTRINPIHIGNFCSIASYVTFQEYNHIINRCSTHFMFQNVFDETMFQDIVSSGSIIVGNDVWIGTHSIILSGAEIGNGAIIGANSVVTSSIPSYAIAVGSPARVIKQRFSTEIVESLEIMRWWAWPLDKIRRNRELFEGEMTMDKLQKVVD